MASDHSGHDMSGHGGHDMSGHAGHDMSGHAGHDMMSEQDNLVTAATGEATRIIGDHSHYVFTAGGHGDGVLQGGTEEVLLFEGAVTSSVGSLVFACIILLVFAILLEYLRLLVWWLESRYVRCSGGRRDDDENITTCNGKKPSDNTHLTTSEGHPRYDSLNLTSASPTPAKPTAVKNFGVLSWVLLSFLHAVTYVWATCLMLITMTFNIYLIVSIAVGVAIGKLATMYTRSKLLPSKR